LRPTYFQPASLDVPLTIKEVFDDLVYKPNWFPLEPEKIKTVVDVGAMIGSFALWAKEQWPNAIIHAFEPDPTSYEYLSKNVHSAKNENQIKLYNLAIWEKNSSLFFVSIGTFWLVNPASLR